MREKASDKERGRTTITAFLPRQKKIRSHDLLLVAADNDHVTDFFKNIFQNLTPEDPLVPLR
jgi:hypothetical protein